MTSSDRVTLAGANNIFDSQDFEMVDLISALDPLGLRKATFDEHIRAGRPTDDPVTPFDDAAAEIERNRLEQAMHAFHLPDYEARKLGSKEERRNRVQDRLLAASEARCSAYTQYLRNFETHWETSLGVLGTIAGAAGAIATGDLNTRVFSGLSAMFGGSRAEIRQGVFRNLASFAIVPGIEQRRREIAREIRTLQKRSLKEYTLQASLYDANRFHAACAMDVGLNAAKDSIQLVENPGALQVTKALARVAKDQQIMRMIELARDGKLDADGAKVVDIEFSDEPSMLYGGAKIASSGGSKAGDDENPALELTNRQFKNVDDELVALRKTLPIAVRRLNREADALEGEEAASLRGGAACLQQLAQGSDSGESKTAFGKTDQQCNLAAELVKNASSALASSIASHLATQKRKFGEGGPIEKLNACIEHLKTDYALLDKSDPRKRETKAALDSSAAALYEIVEEGNVEIQTKFVVPLQNTTRKLSASARKLSVESALDSLVAVTKAELKANLGEVMLGQVRCVRQGG